MIGDNHFIPNCNTHNDTAISAVCLAQDCFIDLCKHCLAEHSKFHKQKNTYMKLVSFEDLRQETRQNLMNLKATAKNYKGYFKIPITEKITDKIRETRKRVTDIVEKFFDKLEKDAPNIAAMANSQEKGKEDAEKAIDPIEKFESDLETFVKKLDQLLYIVEEGNTIITGLREANQKDLAAEWKNIEQKYVSKIDRVAFSRPSNYENTIKDFFERNFTLITVGSSVFSFPEGLRDDDILVEGSMPYIISKLMTKPITSNILGPPLNSGKHKLTVGLEYVHLGGWVGIGVIDTKDFPMASNAYSKAMCICSDNCVYNLNSNMQQPMLTGNVYTITIDCSSGSVLIEGSGGYEAKKTEGLMGKTLYYFFELNGPHKVSILSYEVVV